MGIILLADDLRQLGNLLLLGVVVGSHFGGDSVGMESECEPGVGQPRKEKGSCDRADSDPKG
jgi:hypothetical protein